MMEAKDRIITAKVRLQKDNPFFSWLCSSLVAKEDEKIKTCAVDNRGNLYYAPSFIQKLSDNEVKTLLCHEVMHLALLHLVRVGERDRQLWNVATDIIINNTLNNNGFEFSKGLKDGLVPKNNKYDFLGVKLTDLDKKFAEEVYNLINTKKVKEQMQKQSYGFDIHIFGKDKDTGNGNTGNKKDREQGCGGCGLSEAEKEAIEKEWKQRLAEASAYGKMQGKIPAGIERYVEELLQSKLNWREILYRLITQEIPTDYNYNLPSKRSLAVGVYMPRIKKEFVDVTIAVDTSGSIDKKELTEFLSEIVAIGHSFDNIRLNIFYIDAEVHNHYTITNGNAEEIINQEIQGGGGTDFSSCYEYVEKEIPNTKLLVFFSDGYASYPKEEQIKTLWVITKNGCPNENIPYGDIIRLD